MKQVLTQRGEVKALRALFGCSELMVINALRFRRNTDLAKKIRALALKRGGALVETTNTNITY